ncbi:MAG: carboxypeptidase regulatory-like domain-containing protein [Methanoculleus chikugoensis]|nr:carboxypeptidase regulatory-like domain-containing protein [Methanoculleus chikugoensis]
MNGTTRTWTLSFLLALLLAAVPAAGADLGPNQHLIPELKVNESIETITISAELSLQPEWDGSVTAGIPFGAVMVHTANATTLIFDRDGNHLFSIDDELSAKIPTPAGVEKPCTRVHPLPNDSRVYHYDNVTFVFGTAGEPPILTIIDESPKPDEEPIAINITSLHEGGVAWIDVAPAHVAVVGEVHAPAGVHSVVVRSGSVEVPCGNAAEFACSVPVSFGKNTITVVATDNHGNRAAKTVNMTAHSGIPPPPLITVSGRVTDTGGNPVPGASVRFESVFDLDGEPIAATAVTGEDGCYLVEDALGYRQTVTVEKEGYSPLREEFIFENLTNDLDLELEPSSRTVPGFGSALAVLSLTGAFLLIGRKRR